MKTFRICLPIVMVMGFAATAWGASYLGYMYPAGGQQGTVVRIKIGGQRIYGVRDINISGTGVTAKMVSYEGAGGPLNGAQRELLRQRIQDIIEQRKPAAQQNGTPAAPAQATPTTPVNKPKVTLPDLPDLRNLEQLDNKELRKIADKYVNRQKMTKPPIAEDVTLDVTIAPDAAPGDHELRLLTSNGLSNPMIFQVSTSPEIREKDREDNDAVAPPPVSAPVVLNGQIMPGEVDRFALKLQGGQKLVFTAQARHLIPYLADAVPGWFQAVLTLYDANGNEVAYNDDNGFDPDPIMCCRVPKDGDYVLAVRDAIYRGREDFVYRVSIAEQTPGFTLLPFANIGKVSSDTVPADVDPRLPFVDSQIAQRSESEPNNTGKASQKITLPQLVKGCIAKPGDVDVFQLTGKAGDTIVAEVYARRLGSPMDSLLRIIAATGKVLAWNDDNEAPEMGLVTHQADSYVSTKLPADGIYYVQVSDVQHHGGDAYNYYLRVAAPQADFALRMTPSS
ncbi:MAG TPA: PPC domain-containing protein, partial [Armatimonadota bacterium]|nr:PPC domain-containing protein [Armatimonadota bacterium]